MALALSVKNMICDVDSTTTKNALAAATALPLIKVAGMDNAKIPTIEEAAICCASCRPKRLKIGAMGMAIHLAMGV